MFLSGIFSRMGYDSTFDFEQAETEPSLYISKYVDIHYEAKNSEHFLQKELLLRIEDFFFEQIERHYKSGALAFPYFFRAALLNESYSKKNFGELSAKITKLVIGTLNREPQQTSELHNTLRLSELQSSAFTEPDFTLISNEGVRFPIWRGYLLYEEGFFHGLFRNDPEARECTLDCSAPSLAVCRSYLETPHTLLPLPNNQKILEELNALARFLGWSELQGLCQLKLAEFDESLHDYLTEALANKEYQWVDLILDRLDNLLPGLHFLRPMSGSERIVVTIDSWHEHTLYHLEMFSDFLEQITFANGVSMASFIRESTATFPMVKTVDFDGEPVDFRKHFPCLELGIARGFIGSTESFSKKWFGECGMSCGVWYLGVYLSSSSERGIFYLPTTSDEHVFQHVLQNRTLPNLVLLGSTKITDRSLEAAVAFLISPKAVTLLGPTKITSKGLAKFRKRVWGRLKIFYFGEIPGITQAEQKELKASGLEFEDLDLCFSKDRSQLSLRGNVHLNGEILNLLLERYPDTTHLDVRGCESLSSSQIAELLEDTKLLSLSSDIYSMGRDPGPNTSFSWFSYEHSVALNLPELLERNQRLKRLEFHHCNLNQIDTSKIHLALCLEQISMKSVEISDSQLADLLGNCPNLHSLIIDDCPQLSEKGLDALPESLKHLTLIKTPTITDQALRAILAKHPSLNCDRRP